MRLLDMYIFYMVYPELARDGNTAILKLDTARHVLSMQSDYKHINHRGGRKKKCNPFEDESGHPLGQFHHSTVKMAADDYFITSMQS